MMFCLRSWIPLLFVPSSAPPVFTILYLIITFYLNRPCLYCCFLLVVLIITSCSWADRCFLDPTENWFAPRRTALDDQITHTENGTAIINETAAGMIAGVAVDKLAEYLEVRKNWTGIGFGWARQLAGRREWRVPCLDIILRL